MASVFPAPLPSVLRPNMHSTNYDIYPLASPRAASDTPPPFRPGQMGPSFPYPPYDRIQREQKDYPHIKFWTKEDAMKDPVAHPNKNVRHPIMKKIVEDKAGALVDETRFGEIQGSVRTAASKTLDLKCSWTKQTQARQQEFIALVETLAPELSYCEPEGWKAVAMARTYLDGKTRRGREMVDGTGKKGKKRLASETLAGGDDQVDEASQDQQEDELAPSPAKRPRSADINVSLPSVQIALALMHAPDLPDFTACCSRSVYFDRTAATSLQLWHSTSRQRSEELRSLRVCCLTP